MLLHTGFLLLTAPWWAAPEHVVDGVNYVLVLEVPLVVNGAAMMIGGAVLVIARRLLTLRTRAMGNQ